MNAQAVEVLAKHLYERTKNSWAWEDNEAAQGIYRGQAETYLSLVTPLLALEVKERLEGLERLKPAAHADPKATGYTTIPAADGELLRRADVLAALDKEDSDD